MKKFLLFLSVVIFSLMFLGIIFGSSSEYKIIANGVAASILLTTFIWMPVFLFYAYDRRMRKKEALQAEKEDEEMNED